MFIKLGPIFVYIYKNRAFIKEKTVLIFLYFGSVSERFPIARGGSEVLSFTVKNH